MSLFLSTFLNKIDKTGRVSVPATFRSAISKENFQGIILYKSFTNDCIEGCSISRMDDLSNAVDNLDTFSEEQDELSSLIFADSRQLQFDSVGRVVIPTDLIEFAGIKGEACFVGRGKTFQVWDKEKFAKAQNEALRKAKENRPTLKRKKED